jgi:hypothetical protein
VEEGHCPQDVVATQRRRKILRARKVFMIRAVSEKGYSLTN